MLINNLFFISISIVYLNLITVSCYNKNKLTQSLKTAVEPENIDGNNRKYMNARSIGNNFDNHGYKQIKSEQARNNDNNDYKQIYDYDTLFGKPELTDQENFKENYFDNDKVNDINTAKKDDFTDYDENLVDDQNTIVKENEDYNKDNEKREVVEYDDIKDEDIAAALSKLSPNELTVLNKLIESESSANNNEVQRQKRSSSSSKKHNQDNNNDDDEDDDYEDYNENQKAKFYHDNKRCYDKNCKSCIKMTKIREKRSNNETTTGSPNSDVPTQEIPKSQDQNKTDANIISSLKDTNIDESNLRKMKRHTSNYFKRDNDNDSGAEEKIRAKINYLREKYKREYGDNQNRIRRKRESSNLSGIDSEDPKNPEHIKLLEESFPNPGSSNSFQNNQPHLRVKRFD